MAYKDKNRQREAVKLATRRYRAKHKGITIGVSQIRVSQAIDEQLDVIPEQPISVRPHSCAGCKQLAYNPGVGMSCLHGTVATSIQSIFENEVNPEQDCTELTDSRQAAEPVGAIQ